MKNLFVLALGVFALPTLGQQIILNPDGTHSVVHGSVIVNPNGTHSTIHQASQHTVVVNPNGTHSTMIKTGSNAIIVNPNGTHSVKIGSVIVNPDGSHSTIHDAGSHLIITGTSGSQKNSANGWDWFFGRKESEQDSTQSQPKRKSSRKSGWR